MLSESEKDPTVIPQEESVSSEPASEGPQAASGEEVAPAQSVPDLTMDLDVAGIKVNPEVKKAAAKPTPPAKPIPTKASATKAAATPAVTKFTYPFRIRYAAGMLSLAGFVDGHEYDAASIRELLIHNGFSEFRDVKPEFNLNQATGTIVITIEGSKKAADISDFHYRTLASFVIQRLGGSAADQWLRLLSYPKRSKLGLLPDKHKAILRVWHHLSVTDKQEMLAAVLNSILSGSGSFEQAIEFTPTAGHQEAVRIASQKGA